MTAGNEARIRSIHHLAATDHRAEGHAVARGLCIDRDVRLHACTRGSAGEAEAPARADFIHHEHTATGTHGIGHALEEIFAWLLAAHGFHDHGGDVRAQRIQRLFKRGPVVVTEGNGRALQFARDTQRLQSGDEVPIERSGVAEVRREIPIVPAMIAAEGDAAAPRGRARDAHREREGIATTASIAHLARPRMQREQQRGEGDFLRCIQRAIRAQRQAPSHRCIHLGIGIAEQHRAHAAGEVQVAAPLHVPHARAAGLREIGGPGDGIEALRAL